MSIGKFTHRGVEALKPGPERYLVWEASGHGQGTMGMRVAPTGRKSWVYMFRHDGRARMMTLGKFPEMSVEAAHSAVAKAMDTHAHGEDPAAPLVDARRAERAAETVDELVEQYLELYARPRKRSADRDEALLRRNVLPFWENRKVLRLRRQDCAALLDRIVVRAPVQANRTHSVLSKMFNWAVERGILEQSPLKGLRAPVKESKGRERCLDDHELRRMLTRLDKASACEATRLALRFALLTAARPAEVTGAKWSEIDLEAKVWRLAGKRTKNGESHVLPLSPPAIVVLERAKLLDRGAGAVFPSPHVTKNKGLASGALAQCIGRNSELFEVAPFYAHDLRRTAATNLAELGADWTVLQKVLNHKLRGETAKYVRHGYANEMRAVLDVWGEKLVGLGLL